MKGTQNVARHTVWKRLQMLAAVIIKGGTRSDLNKGRSRRSWRIAVDRHASGNPSLGASCPHSLFWS